MLTGHANIKIDKTATALLPEIDEHKDSSERKVYLKC